MPTVAITIYRLIWVILGLIIPILLRWRAFKGKEDLSRRGERYGHASKPRNIGISKLYWLHGASVGESISSLVLARAIIDQDASAHILITSGTMTSAHMLKQRIKELGLNAAITHQYHPHDHPIWISRFLDHWRPDMVVMMESEIWPNMVTISAERNLPVAMASAQISKKSLRFWTGRGYLLAEAVFSKFSAILAVDAVQQGRFLHLKVAPEKITISGSMKAAAPALDDDIDLSQSLIDAADGRTIILLASSHDDEERIFIDAFNDLNQSDQFFGIIAPRHIARGNSIRDLLHQEGIDCGQLSRNEAPTSQHQAWVADAMGKMGSLIRSADIIVLGGGFANLGGHNPMEMAALGKGVISGPNTHKNTAAFGLLDQHGGLIIAATPSGIADAVTRLSASPILLGKHNQGASYAYRILADAAGQAAKIITAISRPKTGNS